MLKRLYFENFKCWKKFDAPLAPITGFFGPNSSGKTSVLQFILMLKQTKDTTDRGLSMVFGGSNSLANLGNFSSVIHNHDESQELAWKLSWNLLNRLDIADPSGKRSSSLFSGNDLKLEARVGLRRGAPASSYLGYEFDNTRFSIAPRKDGGTEFVLNAQSNEDATPAQNEFSFMRNRGRPWNLPGPIKSYAFPDQAKTFFQNANFLSDFELRFESLMDRIYYLGPLREYPKRDYPWSGASPTDVGQRGEKVVDAILAARSLGQKWNLATRRHFKSFDEILGYWLKQLGLIHSFEVEEIAKDSNLYRVKVRRSSNSSEVLITDVGFGVSQILPVLALLYYVPEHSVVLLEQPEIHLHPAVQSGLADVIINVAGHRKIQVIVESHSEHLLRRLQRRVAEEEVPSKDIALYFCESMRGGESVLLPLEMDLFGTILNWPENFFGDDFGEISAIQEAMLKRRLRAQ